MELDKPSSCLSFELCGDGGLPQVSIEQPECTGKSALFIAKFYSLLIGTSEMVPIMLVNDGLLSATTCLDLITGPNAKAFQLSGDGKHVQLKPGERYKTLITFSPLEGKRYSYEVHLRVEDNPFSDTTIQLFGDGYVADATFDGPSMGYENELDFGEFMVGQTKSLPIKLKNLSKNPIKFTWQTIPPQFTISPSCGIIQVEESQDLTVTLSTPVSLQIKCIHAPLRRLLLLQQRSLLLLTNQFKKSWPRDQP